MTHLNKKGRGAFVRRAFFVRIITVCIQLLRFEQKKTQHIVPRVYTFFGKLSRFDIVITLCYNKAESKEKSAEEIAVPSPLDAIPINFTPSYYIKNTNLSRLFTGYRVHCSKILFDERTRNDYK